MEENKMIVSEETTTEYENDAPEVKSKIGIPTAVFAGSLITLAGLAIGKKVKAKYAEYKAKKEAQESQNRKVIDITDEVESEETE